MECNYTRVQANALLHPGEEEYHHQLSSAEIRIEDAAGVAASGLYVSDGLSLSLWHNHHCELTLPLRARSENACSPIFQNGNAQGLLIMVYVDQCECEAQEGLQPFLELVDPYTRKAVPLHGATPLVSTMGSHLFLVHSQFDPPSSLYRGILRVPVPPFWRLRMSQTGGKPITYAATHSFLV